VKGCISAVTDDMLWNVKNECEVDEDTDCEGGDSDTDWYRWVESDMLCVLGV
jgi:hypothetical protein